MSYLIDAGAAARLTRLITRDTFPPVAHAREWVLDRVDPGKVRDTDGEPPALAELLTCNWCAGWWVSAGVVIARAFAPRLWDPLARALAMSMIVGQVAGWSEREGDMKDLTKAMCAVGNTLADAIRASARTSEG